MKNKHKLAGLGIFIAGILLYINFIVWVVPPGTPSGERVEFGPSGYPSGPSPISVPQVPGK